LYRVVQINPEHSGDAYIKRAEVYQILGKNDEPPADFAKAKKFDDDTDDTMFLL